MRLFLALFLGVILGAAAVWIFVENRSNPHAQSTGQQIESGAKSARDALEAELRKLNLSGYDISNEMARTGRVMRQKAEQAGQAISNATADARITAAIKAKFVADADLSVWNISVDTTEGTVTLAGKVSSANHIGKAVVLAMQTDGVREVISTLQVKP